MKQYVSVLWFIVGMVTACAVGCSSSSSGNAANTGGAAGTGEGGQGTAAGATTNDGSSGTNGTSINGGSSGTAGGADGTGTTSSVVITQDFDQVMSMSYNGGVHGGFLAHYASGKMCTKASSGPCEIDDCTAVLAGKDDEPIVRSSAGTLTVSGGKLTAPLTLMRDADGSYNSRVQGQIFAPGDTLKVSASGDKVPAFSATSGPAPGLATVTAPPSKMGPLGLVYTVPANAALDVRWTGGTAGAKFFVSVTNLETSTIIVCSFDATAGHRAGRCGREVPDERG